MKIRILDRILVALAGLLMLAGCVAVVAQLFFQTDVIGKISEVISNDQNKVWLIVTVIILIALACYCILLLFRRRGQSDKFIMQKTENGELAISLKAMEGMVQKCLEPHKEVSVQSVQLDNQKGGLLVTIRGTVASGVSIPLTVDALQQQIKQYVTACSGVEVKEIRVLVESSGPEAQNAMFAVEPPMVKALPASENSEDETKEGTESQDEAMSPEEVEKVLAEIPAPNPSDSEETEPAVVVPAAAAAAAEMVKNEAPQEEDDRPIHQRLFSSPEEPCVMPMPPEAEEQEKEKKEKAEEKVSEEPPKPEKPPKKEEETPAEEHKTDEIPEETKDEGSKES